MWDYLAILCALAIVIFIIVYWAIGCRCAKPEAMCGRNCYETDLKWWMQFDDQKDYPCDKALVYTATECTEAMCGAKPAAYDYDLRFTYGQDPRWRYPGGACVYPYDIYGYGVVDPNGFTPGNSWGLTQTPVIRGCSAGKK